jgi:hypothetical protein
MWEPRPLATLWASTACNRDIFIFYRHRIKEQKVVFLSYDSFRKKIRKLRKELNQGLLNAWRYDWCFEGESPSNAIIIDTLLSLMVLKKWNTHLCTAILIPSPYDRPSCSPSDMTDHLKHGATGTWDNNYRPPVQQHRTRLSGLIFLRCCYTAW